MPERKFCSLTTSSLNAPASDFSNSNTLPPRVNKVSDFAKSLKVRSAGVESKFFGGQNDTALQRVAAWSRRWLRFPWKAKPSWPVDFLKIDFRGALAVVCVRLAARVRPVNDGLISLRPPFPHGVAVALEFAGRWKGSSDANPDISAARSIRLHGFKR